MADVFTKAKRSEAVQVRSAELGTRSCWCGSEFPEVELVAGDAEVFDDVGNDAAWHIAGMPRKGDEAVRAEGIRVVPVAAGGAFMHTTDLTQATVKLSAVPRGEFAHRSGGENELVAEGGGDGASGFEQRFQMGLGGLLKAERGFAPVAPVRVATGQQRRSGDPHAVFILTKLNFREWNDHSGRIVTRRASGVKRAFDA